MELWQEQASSITPVALQRSSLPHSLRFMDGAQAWVLILQLLYFLENFNVQYASGVFHYSLLLLPHSLRFMDGAQAWVLILQLLYFLENFNVQYASDVFHYSLLLSTLGLCYSVFTPGGFVQCRGCHGIRNGS